MSHLLYIISTALKKTKFLSLFFLWSNFFLFFIIFIVFCSFHSNFFSGSFVNLWYFHTKNKLNFSWPNKKIKVGNRQHEYGFEWKFCESENSQFSTFSRVKRVSFPCAIRKIDWKILIFTQYEKKFKFENNSFSVGGMMLKKIVWYFFPYQKQNKFSTWNT